MLQPRRRLRSALLLAACIAAGSLAVAQVRPTLHKVGEDGVTAPRLVEKVEPTYTEEAEEAEIEGLIRLSIEVHPDGRAHNIQVVESLDPGLDRKAIEAVEQWRFEPAEKDGVPVAVGATIELQLRLL